MAPRGRHLLRGVRGCQQHHLRILFRNRSIFIYGRDAYANRLHEVHLGVRLHSDLHLHHHRRSLLCLRRIVGAVSSPPVRRATDFQDRLRSRNPGDFHLWIDQLNGGPPLHPRPHVPELAPEVHQHPYGLGQLDRPSRHLHPDRLDHCRGDPDLF